MNSLDDLELELRKLPGVQAAGFDERDDMLLVQLHVGDQVDAPEHPGADRRRRASSPATSTSAAAVEVVRWRAIPAPPSRGRAPSPPTPTARRPRPAVRRRAAAPTPTSAADDGDPNGRRARLLAVLAFPDTDELEVHLILDGRRTIGRAVVEQRPASARSTRRSTRCASSARRSSRHRCGPAQLDERRGRARRSSPVALGGVVDDAPTDYGIAAGASPIDAAARSTLDALNRRLAQVL